MGSRSGSHDYTIMVKTADLTDVQRTRKVIEEGAGCSQSCIQVYSWNVGCCQATSVQPGGASRGVGRSWSQRIESRHAEESKTGHIPRVNPLLSQRQRQERLTWAQETKDATRWSQVLFSDESKPRHLPGNLRALQASF